MSRRWMQALKARSRNRIRSAALAGALLVVANGCAAPAEKPLDTGQPARDSAQADAPAAATRAPSAPDRAQLQLRSRRLGVMGTELFIEALHEDEVLLNDALDAAVAEMRRIEDLMTDWRPSPLMELNAAAGSGPVVVDAELARLIERALKISELTGGAFDVTYAAVGELWDFKRDPPRIPDAAEVERALALVGRERVRVDLERSTVSLEPGVRIGLGGIAKGYGVDRAMKVMMKRGIAHATVNAGGDLKSLGTRFGEPWSITIKHPRDPERVIALMRVSNTCVLTSGDYERFFEHEGRRYHHIIDPRSGYPSEGCISATVRAPDAAFADALATALCVLGAEEGARLVEGMPGVEAILVDQQGEVTSTSGL